MLQNLEIINFRTFSRLVVPRLGQVNLIVGKNNVGKTTLLEALRLYGSIWPARTASQILYDRDEVSGEPEKVTQLLLHSLFHGRVMHRRTTATIGPVSSLADHAQLNISADLFTADVEPRENRGDGASGAVLGSYSPAFSVAFECDEHLFRLHSDGSVHHQVLSLKGMRPPESEVSPPFLRGTGTPTVAADTARRWDQIALTESESRVIEALQALAPIRGVSYVADPRVRAGRIARVRVDGMADPVPLAVLGDGTVRMFQIAVALECATSTVKALPDDAVPHNVFPMLLVDEVETGIHYTLHSHLWRFILRSARALGVQVFATTHSLDCLRGFAEAVENDKQCDALAIRLEKVEGEERMGAVIIDRDNLPTVVNEQIEVR